MVFLPLVSVMSAEKNPKLANYYLHWDVSDEQALGLAKWDLLILSPQAVERNADLLQVIKEKNPDIKILAYFLSQEINKQALSKNPSGAWGDIYRKAEADNLWLKDVGGNKLSYWPDAYLINPANQIWNSWLPIYINDNFLKKQSWDGIFYDNCWDNVSWAGFSLDMNNDGQKDSAQVADSFWSNGIKSMLQKTQSVIGLDKIVVCNTGTSYREFYDGRMFETFPEVNGEGWARNLSDSLTTGDYSIINVNTEDGGAYEDFQLMRYGLTSALLGNGYYSFDFGPTDHGQLWWYKEYDNSLGQALSAPVNSEGFASQSFTPGSWRRDFANGLVLVNSG